MDAERLIDRYLEDKNDKAKELAFGSKSKRDKVKDISPTRPLNDPDPEYAGNRPIKI